MTAYVGGVLCVGLDLGIIDSAVHCSEVLMLLRGQGGLR